MKTPDLKLELEPELSNLTAATEKLGVWAMSWYFTFVIVNALIFIGTVLVSVLCVGLALKILGVL